MDNETGVLEKLIELIDAPVSGWKQLSMRRIIWLKLADLVLVGCSLSFWFILSYAVFFLLPAVQTPETLLTIIIALVAVVLQLSATVKELVKPEERDEIIQETVNWNFNKLKKQEKEEHWLLLKALILMKTIQREFKLSAVLKEYPSLFDEKAS